MCDLAYALLAEQVERQVLVAQQVAGMAVVWGAEGVEWPSLEDALRALDAVLVEAPPAIGPVDPERARLRRVLGLSEVMDAG